MLIFESVLGRLRTSVRRRGPAPVAQAPASAAALPRVVWRPLKVKGADVALARAYVLSSEHVDGRGRLGVNECAGCQSTEVSW
ncbi:hypothetical protein CD790_24610 [Streptomyces sp. SAJ15]|nr:hypothetical protein CD790_24610 [Streptomyces sp. SAJ15]